MREDTEKAKKLLIEGDYTFVAVKGEEVIAKSERGVKPLIDLLDSKKSLDGFCVADKVVGKGAGMLYKLLSVSEVYAFLISEHAQKYLASTQISLYYGEKVPAIINRDKTGFCPIESAVLDIFDEKEGEIAIKNTLLALKTNK
ncbi:MAG: DUF1893 domain-containing protein [Clostridia bacterium]|nr:DUF1893 domain-containing protein [Clostridia bacterium]